MLRDGILSVKKDFMVFKILKRDVTLSENNKDEMYYLWKYQI